jgi:membrane-associated phospholipid phosphatase
VPRRGLLLVLCLAGHPAAAQAPNSGAQAPRLVRWPEALGFAAITGITFATDASIRATVQGHNSSFRNSVAYVGNAFGYAKNVYPALLLGTLGGKVIGASDLYRVSWRALKSTALAGGATLVLKSLVGRRRPDVSPDDPYQFRPITFSSASLPSGHTTVAFSFAASLAMETKSVLPDIVLYGLAATTIFARVHVDKHWASDTIVGAGLGILAARIVRRYDRSGGVDTVTLAGNFTF